MVEPFYAQLAAFLNAHGVSTTETTWPALRPYWDDWVYRNQHGTQLYIPSLMNVPGPVAAWIGQRMLDQGLKTEREAKRQANIALDLEKLRRSVAFSEYRAKWFQQLLEAPEDDPAFFVDPLRPGLGPIGGQANYPDPTLVDVMTVNRGRLVNEPQHGSTPLEPVAPNRRAIRVGIS